MDYAPSAIHFLLILQMKISKRIYCDQRRYRCKRYSSPSSSSKQIVEKDIEAMIDPKRYGWYFTGEYCKSIFRDPTGFAPCTPEAVIEVLKAYNIPMEGKRAVIVGRSMVVGRPLSMLLFKRERNSHHLPHPYKDLPGTCQQAEILVAAAGKSKNAG